MTDLSKLISKLTLLQFNQAGEGPNKRCSFNPSSRNHTTNTQTSAQCNEEIQKLKQTSCKHRREIIPHSNVTIVEAGVQPRGSRQGRTLPRGCWSREEMRRCKQACIIHSSSYEFQAKPRQEKTHMPQRTSLEREGASRCPHLRNKIIALEGHQKRNLSPVAER